MANRRRADPRGSGARPRRSLGSSSIDQRHTYASANQRCQPTSYGIHDLHLHKREHYADGRAIAVRLVDVGAVQPDIAENIARLPMVDVFGAYTIIFAVVDGVETDLAIWAPRDAEVGARIDSDRVLRGRRPDAASVNEVAVNETTAGLLGLDIGDQVSIATMTPEQVKNEEYYPPRGPRLQVQVVGMLRGPDDLIAQTEGGFLASEAFLDTVPGKVDEWTTYLAIALIDSCTVADFEAAVTMVREWTKRFFTAVTDLDCVALLSG